jgi:hypothetical protein
VKEYWVQVLKRAAWIFFWTTFSVIVLFGKTANFSAFDVPRSFGFCIIVSAIVQAFKKPSQTSPDNQRTYLAVVTELLHGDRDAAIRLFNYNKEKFGGKTDEWLWQKVIRDLERDRR